MIRFTVTLGLALTLLSMNARAEDLNNDMSPSLNLNLEDSVQYSLIHIPQSVKDGFNKAVAGVKDVSSDAGQAIKAAAIATKDGVIKVADYVGDIIDQQIENACMPALQAMTSSLACKGAALGLAALEMGALCLAYVAPPLAAIGGVGATMAPAICTGAVSGIMAAANSACSAGTADLKPILEPKLQSFCRRL